MGGSGGGGGLQRRHTAFSTSAVEVRPSSDPSFPFVRALCWDAAVAAAASLGGRRRTAEDAGRDCFGGGRA